MIQVMMTMAMMVLLVVLASMVNRSIRKLMGKRDGEREALAGLKELVLSLGMLLEGLEGRLDSRLENWLIDHDKRMHRDLELLANMMGRIQGNQEVKAAVDSRETAALLEKLEERMHAAMQENDNKVYMYINDVREELNVMQKSQRWIMEHQQETRKYLGTLLEEIQDMLDGVEGIYADWAETLKANEVKKGEANRTLRRKVAELKEWGIKEQRARMDAERCEKLAEAKVEAATTERALEVAELRKRIAALLSEIGETRAVMAGFGLPYKPVEKHLKAVFHGQVPSEQEAVEAAEAELRGGLAGEVV